MNGYFAQKIAVLAKQQGREHVLQMYQNYVLLLVVVWMQKHVYMKQNHARFRNVLLVQTFRIIVMKTSTPNAKMQYWTMAK